MKKILSTTLVRVLAVVCGLFGCTLTGYAYYNEEINATQEFYIYNVANGKYLQNNNGGLVLVENIADASAWQFSGTSGSITVKNGDHYLEILPPSGKKINLMVYWYYEDPGEDAVGGAGLNTSSVKVDLSGTFSDGYSFSANMSYGNYGLNKRPYYLSKDIKCIYPNNSTSTKWKLISKRQVDNTISLQSLLTLDAIQGGAAAEAYFSINNTGALTSLTLTNGTTALTINAPLNAHLANPVQIKTTFSVADDVSKMITISDANNTSNFATYSFESSEEASITLTVSTTAESGDAIDYDKKSILITGNVVELEPQTIDWTQDFTSLTPTTAPITLNAIAKNKSGEPTYLPIVYTLASSGVVKIVGDKLYVLTEGNTTIKATVARNATYVGAEKTLNIIVSSISSANNTITPSNAEHTGIYTGTIGGAHSEYIFHRDLREVNLQKCFDNDNQPLFDTLYIFGVTSNTDGALVSYTGANGTPYNNVPVINNPHLVYDADGNYLYTVPFNATTPCYVYAKEEDSYKHARTFDATKRRYDWNTNQNGKHLYFTGYCPFAYMGVTPTAEGWMYFKGGNTAVDIYLDNCEIMGRYKTQTGVETGYENYTVWLEATNVDGETPNVNFLSGSSSPFVFTSTTKNSGESYKPTIHIAGLNHLQGQLGSYIYEVMGRGKVAGQEMTLNAGIDPVFTYSSPITIKPTDLGHKTDLVMTDIWKDNSITNGYLKLDANKGTYSSEKTVAIDLGSANGSLTINGGQYHLRNSAADGTYACNLAVGYRVFDKTFEREVLSIPIKVRLQLYGFGGDVADSKVIINSGTFTMYKNMYFNGEIDAKGDSVFLGEGYYKDQENFLDLRLPAGKGESQINGGTFNGISNVLMCTKVTTTGASPKNGYGDWLCLQEFEVTEEKQKNGSVNFNLPELYIEGERVYEDPQVAYDITNAAVRKKVVEGYLYGGQSVNTYVKDGKCYVNLMLAGEACSNDGDCPDCVYQKEAIIFQWATAIPKFDASKNIGDAENPQWESVSIVGSDSVMTTPEGQDFAFQTNQLLYMDLAGMENYSMHLVDQGAILDISDSDKPRGQFQNKGQYEILKHLNILKVVQADTWYTFTAPFNVQDISVIEINESAIDVNGRKRVDAIRLQAEDNMKLLYTLQDFVIPTTEGRASSLTLQNLLLPNGSLPYMARTPLLHYDGTNMMTANYYLYELDTDSLNTEGEFGTDATGTLLNIDWTPVKRNTGDTIMYKGKTYAIQFPFCPMCNDLESRTYYDYWSNKMILFHGNGPQTVSGTTGQSSLITTPTSGHATLSGNTTLADMTLTAQTAYVHNTANDIFELNDAQYVVKPTEGFLLYNPGAKPMPARISRTGQIEYDENIETGTNGIPTVGDRTSLMLFGAYDGIEVLALHEQLVTIYNLQGNIIFQQYMTAGEQVYVGTGAGVFVVRGESETIKIMVD